MSRKRNHLSKSQTADEDASSNGAAPKKVKSGLLTEEQCFTWEIENFDLVRRSDTFIRKQKFGFKMGETIGLKTKWSFCLRPYEEYVGVFLELKKKPDNAKEVNVGLTDRIRNTTGNGWAYKEDDIGPLLYLIPAAWGCGDVVSRDATVDELPLKNGSLFIELSCKLYAPKPAEFVPVS